MKLSVFCFTVHPSSLFCLLFLVLTSRLSGLRPPSDHNLQHAIVPGHSPAVNTLWASSTHYFPIHSGIEWAFSPLHKMSSGLPREHR